MENPVYILHYFTATGFTCFFVKSIHFDIRFKNRKFAGCLLLIVLLAFPVFLSVDWSLRNVAVKYGTQIIFDNDLFKDIAQNYYLPGTQVVYASGTEKSRIAENWVLQKIWIS